MPRFSLPRIPRSRMTERGLHKVQFFSSFSLRCMPSACLCVCVFSLVFVFHLLNVFCRSEIFLQSTGTRRYQQLRLFLRSFVLDRLWIPDEHGRGICAGECVAAHLRWFDEDFGSEVVFWLMSGQSNLAITCLRFFQSRIADTEQYFLRPPWKNPCCPEVIL